MWKKENYDLESYKNNKKKSWESDIFIPTYIMIFMAS